ncbi:hypothetical protein [Halobacillus seohaensis]|uniref:hypothetical protein n=1 Tax=Halobacillus seohaensis TaxID=447421 RepID=UPI0036F38ED8
MSHHLKVSHCIVQSQGVDPVPDILQNSSAKALSLLSLEIGAFDIEGEIECTW